MSQPSVFQDGRPTSVPAYGTDNGSYDQCASPHPYESIQSPLHRKPNVFGDHFGNPSPHAYGNQTMSPAAHRTPSAHNYSDPSPSPHRFAERPHPYLDSSHPGTPSYNNSHPGNNPSTTPISESLSCSRIGIRGLNLLCSGRNGGNETVDAFAACSRCASL